MLFVIFDLDILFQFLVRGLWVCKAGQLKFLDKKKASKLGTNPPLLKEEADATNENA